jgi:hypothetical protein
MSAPRKSEIFSVADRNFIRDRVLELAAKDARVVSGAVVGSLALEQGDRWSDLDLTFAIADEHPIHDVLEEWTHSIVSEFDAVHLFDLPSGASIYRVFLLPGCLQFDLSFSPASKFRALGPKFKLLFGRAAEPQAIPAPAARELFGYAVHHLVRARFCIERNRFWQAEYWISSARDYGMSLACLRRSLPAFFGRGFDQLPLKVRAIFQDSLVTSLEPDELLRALGNVIEAVLLESEEIKESAKVVAELRKLTKARKG